MCGIAGQFNFQSSEPVDRATVEGMMDTITHRGPDDHGIHIEGPIGLGFRRLSIIDLTSAGHQPMADNEQQVWVTFNGEIYNFRALRSELESCGHRFRGHSDTEVIVYGYKQWGDAILNKLNGMFGLAIWDVRKRRLIIARDQMGIKPVYYRIENGGILYGSEIRPILRALNQRPAVDPMGLNLFLRYRYTPAPYTLHDGIRKLAPGEALFIENGQIDRRRYYDYRPKLFAPQPEPREAQDRLLQLYKEAMERHLVSDVPVGLLLSGGIDSGLLLGLMNLYGKDWPTFTVGYGNSYKDDELDDAAETAAIYGARHHKVHITQDQFEQALPNIVGTLEEPIASSSIVPMYFVCERARQDVTVALVGQGPDETFGGYTRHLGIHYGAVWRKLPSFARTGIKGIVNALPRRESWKRGINSLDELNRLKRYRNVFSLMPGQRIDSLFKDGLLENDPDQTVLDCWSNLMPQMEELDELGGFQLLEIRSSLPDELLMYADKLSMAHSLELRVPYLDREVVEYAQSLDASFKVRSKKECKWLHKQVCSDFLPPEIINRKKRGFAVDVVDEWFKDSAKGKHSQYIDDPNSLIYDYFDNAAIRNLQAEHASGRHNHHKILFSIIVFEEWLRNAA